MRKFSLKDIFNRNKEKDNIIDEEYECLFNKAQSVYLKQIALDTCINFIARAAGQSKFRVKDNHWNYILNVRPNTDMSATQFWERLAYKLIAENQVLVIMNDTNDLLIADSFSRNEYAVYEDTFQNVTVKEYTFKRTFKMNEVFYLEYSNERLDRYLKGLFGDYEELYSKMMKAAKRNNQIRGILSVDATTNMKDIEKKTLEGYVNKLFNTFSDNSIAVVPTTKGFEYKEYSNSTGTSNISVDELKKILINLIDTVADIVGIPTALLHGDRAELKENKEAFYDFCLSTLLRKIEDELNAKTIEPRDYSDDNKIKVIGINTPNIFDLAEPVDKLISSGAFNSNEVRGELGFEPRKGGDKYVMTKNYEPESTAKGGEEE